MRTLTLVVIGILLTVTPALNGTAAQIQRVPDQQAATALPASLDSFYPPSTDRPVYLMDMLKLDTLFSGIAADVMEGDHQGAKSTFRQFRSQYVDVGKMVPEWRQYYPMEPVEKLGAELSSGEPGRIMAAISEVGRLCHECHFVSMVPVQQKYHWGTFTEVRVDDPLSREEVDFSLFKKYLSTNLAGISINLRQGQTENARRQFAGFEARFQALKGSCLNCHDQENRYFVDGVVEDLLGRLGSALGDQKVNTEAVESLIQGIGRESCSKCHLVHVPAALAGVKYQ